MRDDTLPGVPAFRPSLRSGAIRCREVSRRTSIPLFSAGGAGQAGLFGHKQKIFAVFLQKLTNSDKQNTV
jgi:hypothetical protein